jgi:nitrogen fixation protein NifU and related proteins
VSADAPAGSPSAVLQEIILRHYRAPHGKKLVDAPTVTVERANPLCGDTLALSLRVRDGLIEDAGFQAQACSITQATASMVMARVVGADAHGALALVNTIEALADDAVAPSAPDDDLQALRSVARFPARRGCVRLVTSALREAVGTR